MSRRYATRDDAPGNSPDNLSITLPSANDWDGSSQTPSNDTIGVFPHATVFKVTATGFHTRTPIDSRIDTVGNWGPSGNASIDWTDPNGIHQWRVITQGGFVDESATIYAQISGTLFRAARAGYAMRTISGQIRGIYCGPMYGTTCDHWTGQTTITLVRLSSDLDLSADSTTVEPFSPVTFSFGADPLVVEGQSMPFEIDATSWTPDGPEDGGDPFESAVHAAGTGACQLINPCRRTITGGGTFTLSAWVNGKRISKSVHVSARVPRLTVKCTASADSTLFAVVRGQSVRCKAYLDTHGQFDVDSAVAEVHAGNLAISGAMNSAGTEWISEGPAADGTVVDVWALVGNVHISGRGFFGVSPRPDFPSPQIAAPVSVSVTDDLGKLFALPQMDDTSGIVTFGSAPPVGVVPNFTSFESNFDSVTTGPNKGLSYLTQLPLTATVYLNNILFDSTTTGGRWLTDQNGTNGVSATINGVRFCDHNDIAAIIDDVKRHEGVGLADSSHVGIYNFSFRGGSLAATVESHVLLTSDGDFPWRQWARAVVFAAAAATQPAQDAWDASDGNATKFIRRNVGCYIDNNPFTP